MRAADSLGPRGGWAFAFVVVVCLASPVRAQVTTLDAPGDVGEWASVAIGSDGLALISYYDRTNGDLKAAHCSDVACTGATLATLDSAGDVGSMTSITIGGDGQGLVSYQDVAGGIVKVAHCLGSCSSADLSVVGAGQAGGIATGADGLGLLAWQSSGAVVVTHCDDAACSARTSTTYGAIEPGEIPKVSVGPDGLGLVVYEGAGGPDLDQIVTLHCVDTACTAATTSIPLAEQSFPPFYTFLNWHHDLAFGADGRALFTYVHSLLFPPAHEAPEGDVNPLVAHCIDAACSTVDASPLQDFLKDGSLAAGPDGLGLLAAPTYQFGTPPPPGYDLLVLHCGNATCSGQTASAPLDSHMDGPALVLGQDALPLIAYQNIATDDLRVIHCLNAVCGLESVSVGDATVVEGDSGAASAVFPVTLSGPVSVQVTVDFTTADGTATAPGDYVPASGTLSFAPGVTTGAISVSVTGDTIDEADETFTVTLGNPSNASVGDGQGLGTIVDDDGPPAISISGATVVEGGVGTVDASLLASLSHPSSLQVAVDWQTTAGPGATATPGVDFLVANGSVLFAPGELTHVLTASVFGDSVVEPDELFHVQLSNPVNATIADDLGPVTIVDDDAPSLSFDELVHGSDQRHDLQALPGPVADRDYYRLAQLPHSSWEVVVDGASGDVPPLIVERLAADNVTVLQTATTVSGGSSLSMRWRNETGFPVTNQHLSVGSAGCGASCDASAVYRIRSYETTGRIERFNNSGTQVTVVVLGNTTSSPVQGTVWFWSATGALLASQPLALAPQASYVLSTAAIPALVGTSGSIAVTHDGRYGDLQGKAVAVEPATGFTFDTRLTFRSR